MQVLTVILICVAIIWFLNKTFFKSRRNNRRVYRRHSHFDTGTYYTTGSGHNDGYYTASSSTEFGGGSFGGGGAGGDWGDSGGDSGGGDGGGGDGGGGGD